MALPNLLVPGVTKSGTTSLYHSLSGHPSVNGGAGKELNLLTRGPVGDDDAVAAWDDHFRECADGAYRLDVSPQYFAAPVDVVARLRRLLPDDTRVLITLRDPVTRLWSAYRMKRIRGRLGPEVDFESFLERASEIDEDVDLTGSVYATLATGRYERFLPTWLDTFGDGVRVVFFEDMARDPQGFLAAILEWLDLDPSSAVDLDATVRNVTMRHRNPRLAVASRWLYRRFGTRLGGATDALRRLYERVNADPLTETFTAERRQRVAAMYASSCLSTAEIITAADVSGPLPAWLAQPGLVR